MSKTMKSIDEAARELLTDFAKYIQKQKNKGLDFDCVEREVDLFLNEKNKTKNKKPYEHTTTMQLTKLLTLGQFIDSCEGSSEPCYFAIVKYNNFLKQPLTKEMFVGDMAIFDDESVYVDKDYPSCICIKSGGVIPFGWEIYDLAQLTNGTLTLKNVEI